MKTISRKKVLEYMKMVQESKLYLSSDNTFEKRRDVKRANWIAFDARILMNGIHEYECYAYDNKPQLLDTREITNPYYHEGDYWEPMDPDDSDFTTPNLWTCDEQQMIDFLLDNDFYTEQDIMYIKMSGKLENMLFQIVDE